MLIVHTSLKPSPIHGLGCFTNQRIRRGDIVWVFDPRIDRRLPVEDLTGLPEPAQELFHRYGYVEMYRGQRVVTLCGDHSKHMNHSDTPNLINGEEPLDTNVAVRDIEEGEELTCNYYSFDLDAERKLGTRAATVGGGFRE